MGAVGVFTKVFQLCKKKKAVKYVHLKKIPKLRTEKETALKLKEIRKARRKNKFISIYGFKSVSLLVKLKKFEIIKGSLVDMMHCIFLGVCRQFANYWFTVKKQPYSINTGKIKIIDSLLKKIQVPKLIDRLSRSLVDRKFWNSRDWENCMLYYSIPILNKVPGFKKYAEHWALLVEATRILISPKITKRQLILANKKIADFIKKTQILYGRKAMTNNVHELKHLVQSVIDWGPLLFHSCYPFVAGNGIILEIIKSSNGVVH